MIVVDLWYALERIYVGISEALLASGIQTASPAENCLMSSLELTTINNGSQKLPPHELNVPPTYHHNLIFLHFEMSEFYIHPLLLDIFIPLSRFLDIEFI